MTPQRVTAAVPVWRQLVTNRLVVAAAVAIPLVVVVALIGGALVREAAFGPVGDASGSPTPDPTVSAATGSASASPSVAEDLAFPTPGETRLVQLIPGQYREGCQRADPEDAPIVVFLRDFPGLPDQNIRASFSAGIECDLGGMGARARSGSGS